MRFGSTVAVGVLLTLAVLAAPGAYGQNTNVVVVCDPADPDYASYQGFGWDIFPTVAAATTEAITRAEAAYQRYSVLVDNNDGSTAWAANLTIPSDVPITIQGAGGREELPPLPYQDLDLADPPKPYEVILESGDGGPVIEVIAPMGGWPEDLGGLIVQGVTLTGGNPGVLVRGGGAPTFNRCYIYDNTGDGVLCEDPDSHVLLVNCSISKNGRHGVNADAGGFAEILYCSIIGNVASGAYVYASAAADASVKASLIYQNYTSGLEWDQVSTPELSFNDVYMNPTAATDYVNVTADADSISDDPLLADDADWIGQISQASGIYSPVIDAVLDSDLVMPPFTLDDFEFENRPIAILDPSTPRYDIGADEVSYGLATFYGRWYYCLVTPNPVPAMGAGDLDVVLRVTRAVSDFEAFIVPQGADVNRPAEYIWLDITSSDGETYYATNLDAIQTVVLEQSGGPGPHQGDIIADGHGVVYLNIDGVIYGDRDTGTDAFVEDQARLGRHLLIDTIAPTYNPALLPAAANVFVTASNDTYTPVLTVAHPYPALPGGWPPTTVSAPIDNGLVVPFVASDPTTYNGPGAQVFFNVGSISNFLTPENLDITVTAQLTDQVVVDAATGAPITGLDAWTGFTSRQPSAFPVSGTTDSVFTGPAQWHFLAGQSLIASANAAGVYRATGANPGFTGGLPGIFLDDNLSLREDWTFSEGNPAVPGLSWFKARDQLFHVSTKFLGVDRAGNRAEPNQTPNPIQIWWFLRAQTRITPNRENQTVEFPDFQWQLDRPVADPATGAPEPLYTYRLYYSPNYNGPYAPVPDLNGGNWAPWSTIQRLNYSDLVAANVVGNPTYAGAWLMLIVAGADEAGNIEAWPGTTTPATNDDVLDINAPRQFNPPSGLNWQRFKIGTSTAPDTVIAAQYWHNAQAYDAIVGANERDFGSQSLIPVPQDPTNRVEARFTITMQTERMGSFTNARILWQLIRDGQEGVAPTVINMTTGNTVQLVLPLDVPTYFGANYRLEDPALRGAPGVEPRPVTYVFRAWSLVQDASGATVPDPTPATVTFTIVPSTSVETYVRNRESTENQPIKTQEKQ